MEVVRKVILLITILTFVQPVRAQSGQKFCRAVERSNFRKVERIVKKLVKKNRVGVTYFNGVGSGYQISLAPSLDSITGWLKGRACVADAYWDRCQGKPAIYPGSSSIGVILQAKTGEVEKCFRIQEGTTGQLNLFGWRPTVYKPKKILVYRKMSDCAGFIELQRKNCGKKN
jgi:hypothetical protein